MTSSIKILIKEQVAVDLALRDSAVAFFKFINSLKEEHIIVDFKDIKSISRSFAHEYYTQKSRSTKNISEANVPENVRKMFEVVAAPSVKIPIFDVKTVRVATL